MNQNSNQNHKKNSALILLRGMAMGAADVVPGVSGGTMALITGIYERLIHAVGAISKKALPTLRKEGMAAAWKAIDGTFLLLVGTGILLSVFSVARIVSWGLQHYPPVVWSFFFGLIVASTGLVLRGVGKWNALRVGALLLCAAILVLLGMMTPATTTNQPWFVFLSGVIAISAMILPGISGSFLLVLLGKYEYVLQAVHDLNIGVLVVFAAGCAVGILTSARIIGWLFKRFHDTTMAAVVGIMIGSLYKVWPWRQATLYSGEYGTEEFAVLADTPVLPGTFSTQSVVGLAVEQQPYVLASVIAFCIGIVIVVLIERKAKTVSQTHE